MKKLLLLLALIVSQSLMAQNVGIGTTSPAARLHVSAGDASLALFGPSGSGGSLYVGAGGNQGVAFTAQVIASDGNLHIDPAANRNIFIGYFQPRDIYLNPSGGSVGIGTTTPLATLHIFNGPSGNSGPFSPLVVESNNNTYINLLSPNANETGVLFGKTDNAASGGIVYNSLATPNGFQFRNNGNVTRIVIANTGNVGIGTTSPAAMLHVNGVSQFTPGGSNIQILDGNRIQAYANGGLNLTTYSDDPIKFTTFTNGGSGSERMRILSNGNVGIGTASPSATLHVSAGDASLALFGPNTSGGRLYVGASANTNNAGTAQVISTNGNLHIDPAPIHNIYIGYYQPNDIYMNTNGGNVNIGGYTKLGGTAPSIKMLKLTGTTAATDGGNVDIAHGLNQSKILSISVLVLAAVFTSSHLFPANFSQAPGYNFSWREALGNIRVNNTTGNCANILSTPIRILITYEE